MTLVNRTTPYQKQTRTAPFIFKLTAFIVLLASLLCTTSCQPTSNTDASSNTQSNSEPLRLAAASNLARVLPSIISAYKIDANLPANNQIEVTYASSGKLYAQIRAGAPYDIFLSANRTFPAKLAQPSNHTPFTYTQGQLALFSASNSVNDKSLDEVTITSLLNDSQSATVALANPQLAPYGASAKAYLESQGLYGKLAANKRLIQAENISQAFQYTYTGSVDYGFVALSQLLATNVEPLHYVALPVDSYPAILQDAIIVDSKGSTSAHAKDFIDFLQSDTAQDLFVQAGYLKIDD